MHVRDVDLDDRPDDRGEGVTDGHGGVRPPAGVDDHPGRGAAHLVDRVDEDALVVGLPEVEVVPQLVGPLPAQCLHVGERLVAVDLGLALTEQVEVGPVEDHDDRSSTHAEGVGFEPTMTLPP